MTVEMTAEYWDKIAGPQWVASQARMDPILAPFAEALRPFCAAQGVRRIVDIGCGCGASTLVAREAAPAAEILGVDVSGPMLAVAKERLAACGDTSSRFVHADAAAHPVEPGSVDLIVSRFGVMFFPDPSAAFSHLRGWLSPTGQMVLMVWAGPEHNPWLSDIARSLRHLLDAPPPVSDGPGPFSLSDATRRAAIFAAAGLDVIAEDPISPSLSISGSVDELVGFYCERGPLAAALHDADSERRAAILAGVRAWVEAHIHDGAVTLPSLAIRLVLRPASSAAPSIS